MLWLYRHMAHITQYKFHVVVIKRIIMEIVVLIKFLSLVVKMTTFGAASDGHSVRQSDEIAIKVINRDPLD